MDFRVVSVGRVRDPHLRGAVQEYVKRLQPYARVELVEGLEEKRPPRLSESEDRACMAREAERLLATIRCSDVVLVFDQRGTRLTSEQFAHRVRGFLHSGARRVDMVIGGSTGLDERVRQRADQLLSLSDMTLPHQLAVVVVVEQLYRAFRILQGQPYHK